MSGFEDVYIATILWGLAAGSGMAGLLLFFTSIDSALRICVISALSAALGAILLAAVFWPSASERQLARELSSIGHIGQFLPADDSMPKHAPNCIATISKANNGKIFVVMFGNVVAGVSSGSRLTVILSGNELFTADFRDNQLLISTYIHDENGDIIAQIDDNVWRVAAYVPWYDRPDAHTLRVYDRRAKPVLYIRLMSRNVIKINGLFRLQGSTLFIGDNEISFKEDDEMEGVGIQGGGGLGLCFTEDGPVRLYGNREVVELGMKSD